MKRLKLIKKVFFRYSGEVFFFHDITIDFKHFKSVSYQDHTYFRETQKAFYCSNNFFLIKLL